jgi:hypothetical protein
VYGNQQMRTLGSCFASGPDDADICTRIDEKDRRIVNSFDALVLDSLWVGSAVFADGRERELILGPGGFGGMVALELPSGESERVLVRWMLAHASTRFLIVPASGLELGLGISEESARGLGFKRVRFTSHLSEVYIRDNRTEAPIGLLQLVELTNNSIWQDALNCGGCGDGVCLLPPTFPFCGGYQRAASIMLSGLGISIISRPLDARVTLHTLNSDTWISFTRVEGCVDDEAGPMEPEGAPPALQQYNLLISQTSKFVSSCAPMLFLLAEIIFSPVIHNLSFDVQMSISDIIPVGEPGFRTPAESQQLILPVKKLSDTWWILPLLRTGRADTGVSLPQVISHEDQGVSILEEILLHVGDCRVRFGIVQGNLRIEEDGVRVLTTTILLSRIFKGEQDDFPMPADLLALMGTTDPSELQVARAWALGSLSMGVSVFAEKIILDVEEETSSLAPLFRDKFGLTEEKYGTFSIQQEEFEALGRKLRFRNAPADMEAFDHLPPPPLGLTVLDGGDVNGELKGDVHVILGGREAPEQERLQFRLLLDVDSACGDHLHLDLTPVNANALLQTPLHTRYLLRYLFQRVTLRAYILELPVSVSSTLANTSADGAQDWGRLLKPFHSMFDLQQSVHACRGDQCAPRGDVGLSCSTIRAPIAHMTIQSGSFCYSVEDDNWVRHSRKHTISQKRNRMRAFQYARMEQRDFPPNIRESAGAIWVDMFGRQVGPGLDRRRVEEGKNRSSVPSCSDYSDNQAPRAKCLARGLCQGIRLATGDQDCTGILRKIASDEDTWSGVRHRGGRETSAKSHYTRSGSH